MSKWITHWTVAFITAIVMIFVHYGDSTIVQTARLKQFDLLQNTDQPIVSQDIVVVAIDEPAIEKYGQWPWKRDVLAYNLETSRSRCGYYSTPCFDVRT